MAVCGLYVGLDKFLLLSEIVVFFFLLFRIKTQDKRGEWDSNPRVLANMGLAIPRPTRLGDPRLSDDLDFLLLY